MAGISPGMASVALRASENLGAAQAQKKDRLAQGLGQLGAGVGAAVGEGERQKQAESFLVQMGDTPEQAKSVVAQGPRFFANYVADKAQTARQAQSEKHDESMLGRRQTFETAMDEKQAGRLGFSPDGTFDPKRSPAEMEWRARQEALGAEATELTEPPEMEIDPRGSGMFGNLPTVRQPPLSQGVVMGRASDRLRSGRPVLGESLKLAQGMIPKAPPAPKPTAPPKWDETPDGYRRRKEIDAEFAPPEKPPAQRNIDPLSPEGMKARMDYEEKRLKGRIPESLRQRASAAKVKIANAGTRAAREAAAAEMEAIVKEMEALEGGGAAGDAGSPSDMSDEDIVRELLGK